MAHTSEELVTKKFWQELGKGARVGLVAAVATLVGGTALAGYWLLRSDYQVLFADLTPQDAAAMSAELERQKIPFTVGETGEQGATTILVDRKDVYKTRMKLMGKDLPLHGAVGFELFNGSDFGATEFAQRINYQRALQGELTRTILSLEEVRDARVLLALPEQGLFKQARQKATASITLRLKQQQTLSPARVSGIQRLVASAVPGIAAQDVTIVDQSGVALTRSAAEAEQGAGTSHLDLKKDTENYLTRKASEVLDRTLGSGQALASVDVTLDMDRVQTTTEDVLAAPATPGHQQTGVVVRERETLREGHSPLTTRASSEDGEATAGGSSQREVEYTVGRRVEQVIGQPGSIKSIQVVAIVKRPLDGAAQEQLRKVLAASVGAAVDRGDTVVVTSIEALAARRGVNQETVAPVSADGPAESVVSAAPSARARGQFPGAPKTVALAIGGVLALAALAWWGGRRGRRSSAGPALSAAERQAALKQVQTWMRSSAGSSGGPR